jgi:DNA-directed RNA polymerase specialized sigma24 family protein
LDSSRFAKSKWILTQQAFDRLLAQLDPDRDQAGIKYENLRRRLVKLFEWRGAFLPEDLADDTLNRVAKSLETGEEIANLTAYCIGIARNVFLESLRLRRREAALQSVPQVPAAVADETRRECLEHCLRGLSRQDFHMIIQYYQENKRGRIEARRDLACRIGIPLNALRIRMHRIRVQLQECVENCLKRWARE